MRVRRQTWAIAAIFLLAFCWLGVAAVKCAPIYQVLEVRFPADTRFASAYGAVVFPLLGVGAAAALILFDVFLQRRWVQGVLLALFATFLIWAFRALLFIPVSIGPATPAN